MRKKILEPLLSLGFFVSGYIYPSLQAELTGLSFGIAGILLLDLIEYLIKERSFLKLYWDCHKPFTGSEIRLTIAYLFRIEVNGKYLLVKSHRIDNTFQPVGGVYKYFNPEAKLQLDCMGAITDNKIGNDNISECDLRLNLTDRKKIGKFLKWFFNAKNRECDPWREFYEELIGPGILPAKEFPYMHYILVGQHFEPIHNDPFFNVDTFKYADIYVPTFITARQTDAVYYLASHESSEYIWVTQREINQGISDGGHRIAEHSHKIFHNKFLHQ
ncbi:MAG: hypothetical protein WC699_15960 [Bacteroidales bacterium]|jgi:hypothetical protein